MWHLRRAPRPLLNLRTLRVHTFRLTAAGGSLYWLVCGAVPFLLPLEFQTQFGWSPVKSGAVTLFMFAGNVGIKPATTPLINRFGFRTCCSPDAGDGGGRRAARVHDGRHAAPVIAAWRSSAASSGRSG